MFSIPVVTEVDLYKFDPWDLPGKAMFGDGDSIQETRNIQTELDPTVLQPRDIGKPRAQAGQCIHHEGRFTRLGRKKRWCFTKGRAPKGVKATWEKHEYRLADGICPPASQTIHRKPGSLRLDDWVLCRIFNKSPSTQRASGKDINSSNVEGVLASLPEIDNSGLVLPGSSPPPCENMLELEPLWEDGGISADAASQLMSHLNNYHAAATATPAADHYNSPWTNVVPLLDGARVQARFNSYS